MKAVVIGALLLPFFVLGPAEPAKEWRVEGELQERWRSTDGVTKPQPLFWINGWTFVVDPDSSEEAWLESQVGRRVTIRIEAR